MNAGFKTRWYYLGGIWVLQHGCFSTMCQEKLHRIMINISRMLLVLHRLWFSDLNRCQVSIHMLYLRLLWFLQTIQSTSNRFLTEIPIIIITIFQIFPSVHLHRNNILNHHLYNLLHWPTPLSQVGFQPFFCICLSLTNIDHPIIKMTSDFLSHKPHSKIYQPLE